VKANYLASPPLVVAYALAGTVDVDLDKEPLGFDQDGKPVFLREIWPSQQEIADAIASSMSPEAFRKQYGTCRPGPAAVAQDHREEERLVRVRRQEHLHPGAAVLHDDGPHGRHDRADLGAARSRCSATR
jgi:aconitase A